MTVCETCGACCAYSASWPIFSTDDEDDLELIPSRYRSDDLRGMRCSGDRCSALVGEVGQTTHCAIYGLRPDVCRVCQVGDEACVIARRHFGLPVLAA